MRWCCAQRGTRLVATRSGEPSETTAGYYFVAGDDQPTFGELGQWIGRCLGRQQVRVLAGWGTASLWSLAVLAEVVSRVQGKPYIFNFDKAREARPATGPARRKPSTAS